MNKTRVLEAYLRQTKRVPETLNKYKTQQVLDTEYGIIYPAFRGIEKEDVLKVFQNVFADLKSSMATFHKSWEVIENTEQGKLWLEAIMHYMTTYGFENLGIDANGYTYIPEELCEVPELRKFKVIGRITNSEAHCILEDILYHGNLGLKAQTIDDLLVISEDSGFELDINEIKNKEVKTLIAYKEHLIPSDTNDVIRLLNYVHTGKTTLIKDNEHFTAYWSHLLRDEEKDLLNMILTVREVQLAETFNRYKPLFISIRKRGYKKQINRISKLSKKYHKPMKSVEWLTTRVINGKTLKESDLDSLELNDLVKIYNSLNYTSTVASESVEYKNAYVIRNGKVFIKKSDKVFTASQTARIYNALETIKKAISSRVDTDTYVVVPDNIELAFPTSEKSFIGDIPIYSQVTTKCANAVGISWNHDDIDLSAILKDGQKIGWNSNYKTQDHDIMYSGDMTRAICTNPECSNYKKTNGQATGICPECGKPLNAAEFLYIGSDESVLVMNNLFNSEKNTLNLFLAELNKEEVAQKRNDRSFGYDRNTIVDPNKIIYSAKINQDTRSQTLGVFFKQGEENKFAFANLGIGNSNVSFSSEVTSDAIDVIEWKAKTALKLKDIYNVYTETEYEWMLNDIEEFDSDSEARIAEIQANTLDLSDLDKATIMRMDNDNFSLLEYKPSV